MATKHEDESVETNQTSESEPEETVIENDGQSDETIVEDVETIETDDSTSSAQQSDFDQLKQEKDELFQRMLRNQAEFDNFKKRTKKERANDQKYKSQDLATELLPALDNFERAMSQEVTEANQGFVDGIKMVYNQIKEALESQGIEEIEAVGQTFDPNLHHAVMQVEEEGFESNTVVDVLQKGYMLKDRVIRPSMVKVNQ